MLEMEGVIENTGAVRDTVRGLRVLLKVLPRMLLDLLVSVQSFLKPKEKSNQSANSTKREGGS